MFCFSSLKSNWVCLFFFFGGGGGGGGEGRGMGRGEENIWELFVFFCSFSELLSFCFPPDHLQACCLPSLCQPKLLPTKRSLSLSLSLFSLSLSLSLSLSPPSLSLVQRSQYSSQTIRTPCECRIANLSEQILLITVLDLVTVSISSLQIPHHPFPRRDDNPGGSTPFSAGQVWRELRVPSISVAGRL